MSRIHFSTGNRHTESRRYWMWRELRSQTRVSLDADNQLHNEFCRQAQQVREQLCFLLEASPEAEEALTALAEEDMTNFCIMVDLAQDVVLDTVDPLPGVVRERLTQFLVQEPWRSLAVDNEISVALALLDSLGAPRSDTPLTKQPPGLLNLIESVLNNVDKEQYNRFLQEYQQLAERDQLSLPDELSSVFSTLVLQAADRLGVKPPADTFWHPG